MKTRIPRGSVTVGEAGCSGCVVLLMGLLFNLTWIGGVVWFLCYAWNHWLNH